MPLLPNGVCFGNPAHELCIDFFSSSEPEMVNMVSWRNRVNPEKTWMLRPFRKYEVATQPGLLDRDGHKGHANVESDPGLLGKDCNRTASSDCHPQMLEQALHRSRPSAEMRFQVLPRAAKVRLVPIGKGTGTLWTSPKALTCKVRPGGRSFQDS